MRARKAAGFSQRRLGERVGVSANMIKKYERDESMPRSPILIALAQALGVRTEYFFRPERVELQGISYRKRARTPRRVIDRVRVDVLDQAERWLDLADLWPGIPVQPFTVPEGVPGEVSTLDELEAVANGVRAAWELGYNPVPDLTDVLEAHGILVIATGADDEGGFDGMQAWVNDQPVIVISDHWPGDRQRFTLAHELGHLLLQGRLSAGVDSEKAANRFAGAFLLPSRAVFQVLGKRRAALEIRELYLLKQEFGLSMQGCLYRAADLGIISRSWMQALFRDFRRQGWHRREPGERLPGEQTFLFQQLVYRALGQDLVSESRAAELLGLSQMELHRQRRMGLRDATADQ